MKMNNEKEEAVALVELTGEWREELRSVAEEFRAAGDDRYAEVLEDTDAYFRRVWNYSHDLDLPPGHVPSHTFVLVRARRILGRSSFRRRLTPDLEHEGGHIGYDIRPAERQRGYGTLILALTLRHARAHGLKRVLVTCDTDNLASARIIEKNGGALAGRAISRRSGRQISQYWIELLDEHD